MSKKIRQKKLKKNPNQEWENQLATYKFHKVGIIKKVKFGRSVGTRFGAFGYMMDGPFGLQLEIIDEKYGFPISYMVMTMECKDFFDEFKIDYDHQLIGKPVLLLSNSEAINDVGRVIPHKKLMEVWKNE